MSFKVGHSPPVTSQCLLEAWHLRLCQKQLKSSRTIKTLHMIKTRRVFIIYNWLLFCYHLIS